MISSTTKNVKNKVFSSRHFSAAIGSANLDWPSLGFACQPTAGHVEFNYSTGSGWDKGKFEPNPILDLHICSNVLHYGQALFEGLKGYHCADGKFRLFRDAENFARMNAGCERVVLQQIPADIWQEAIDLVCKKNKAYIPT